VHKRIIFTVAKQNGIDLPDLAAAIANKAGLLNTYAFFRKKLTKSQVAVLIYHRVRPKKDNWSLEPMSPESFEKQIKYFSRNYEIIPLDSLAEGIKQGNGIPSKAVVITFDDGYKDNYTYAYPTLKKYNVPATIFLTTGLIGTGNLFWWDKVKYIVSHTTSNQLSLDPLGNYPTQSDREKIHTAVVIVNSFKQLTEENRSLMITKLHKISGVNIPGDLGKELILSWDEVREMNDDGVVFGAHSVNHPILTNMPLEQAKWEILQSKKDIEEKLGKKVTSFAYPNGDFNYMISKFVKENSFIQAFSVSGKLISSRADPYELSRIEGIEDFNKFMIAFCGLWGDARKILSGRMAKGRK